MFQKLLKKFPSNQASLDMDQSDLQLYSLDKDLVDSMANQNLSQNSPLGLNSNKASLDYQRKAYQNLIINQNLKNSLYINFIVLRQLCLGKSYLIFQENEVSTEVILNDCDE